MSVRCSWGWNGGRCLRWDCAQCSLLKAGDQRGVLLGNLLTAGVDVWLMTVTAPGDSVLPRDSSGLCRWDELAAWCATRGLRWRRLRTAAAWRGGRSPVLATVWQAQPRRGAPHAHLVVRADEEAHAWALAVDRLAPRHGFGYVDVGGARSWRSDQPQAWSGARAAAYLSRYLNAGFAPWTAREWRALMPRVRRVHVHPELTRATWDTMRTRQLRRHLYAAKMFEGSSWPRFKHEREMVAVSRQLRGRPVGDLSVFSDVPYSDLRSSEEREAAQAISEQSRPATSGQGQLVLPLPSRLHVP